MSPHTYNSRFRCLVVISAVLFIVFLSGKYSTLKAQSATDNGTPLGLSAGSPEGSYALSGFENINLYNGNLNFSLPALHVGGRGHAGYAAQVPIDQRWVAIKSEWYDENNNLFYSIYPASASGSNYGNYGPGSVGVQFQVWKPQSCQIGYQTETTYEWARTTILFTAPDGTQHELVDPGTLGQPIH